MLKSPDGNWIALQSTKVSNPSLLTERKRVIAHEGLGSDGNTTAEPDSSWADALQEIHRAFTDSTSSGWTASTLANRRGSGGDAIGSSEGSWKSHQPLLALLSRKVEATQSPPSCRNSILDVNLNVEEEEPEAAAEQEEEEEQPATSCLPVRNTHNLQ